MADTTTELQELAAIIDAAEAEPEPELKPTPDAPPPADSEAQAEPEPEPEAEKPKPEKPETESKAWQRIRRRTKEQDAKEQQLARAEASLKANESALQAKASEAARILALHERAKTGDPAALQELGYDLEALNSSYLKHQTGDARLEQMERRQREQEKREEEAASRKEKERQEREEQERAEAAMNTVFEEAKKMPLLGKKSRDRVVALCEYVAQEWVSGGRRFTFPELVQETEKRLAKAIEDDAAALGFVRPTAKETKPATPPVTRRLQGERGDSRKPPATKEEELQDIAALFD